MYKLIPNYKIRTSAVTASCQQATEKYYKVFLLENEWEIEKAHDLAYLYQKIKKIKDLNLNEAIID
ncbi:MAG: HEPN domain-containing protein [Endomicrobium sp.]|jgi:HEPN domain-containing protein|nr:HEPN domain-containing protein [Endomicrobium sp.]